MLLVSVFLKISMIHDYLLQETLKPNAVVICLEHNKFFYTIFNGIELPKMVHTS